MLVRLDPDKSATTVHVDPARPEGRRSRRRRLRDRQDQRRLLRSAARSLTRARRSTHAHRHPDQPRRRRQLRRLPAAPSTALGCVYIDVDRRYYNYNVGLRRRRSTPRSTSSPATRSCAASDALDYVRFRHTDSDFVRAARQQDFLRQAKEQVGARAADLGDRKELLRIFGKLHAHRHRAAPTDGLLRAAQARRSLGRPPDPRGPVPGADVTPAGAFVDVDAAARSPRSRREFLHAPRVEPASARQRGRRAARRRKQRAASGARRRAPAALAGRAAQTGPRTQRDPAAAQAAASRVYYPKLRLRAAVRRLRRDASAARPARLHASATATASATRAYRIVVLHGAARPVLRRPGHDLDGPADPRQPDRETRTISGRKLRAVLRRQHACGSSPGRRRAPSTGSRTRCSQTLDERPDARDRRAR